MTRLLISTLAVLAIATSAEAAARSDAAVGQVVVARLPAGVTARPVAITKFSSPLNDNQIVGEAAYGVICVEKLDVRWKQVRVGLTSLKTVFGEELKASGFAADGDPGSLFADKESGASDLEVGAIVKGVDASICENLVQYRATLKLDLEWQVYSNLRRSLLATIDTHGVAQRTKRGATHEAERTIEQDAFADNVRALLSNAQFRQIVTAAELDVASANAPSSREPIQIDGGRGPVTISDAVGSVASIFAGQGFGTGVLISTDGYMLTDQHVVGAATRVRVRWSDGFETTGEVLRTDKRRDVALVKTETHGRQPLAIHRSTPAVGSTVFAIGTPLDPKLQSTVTKGIVSANRIVDGFSFIQSDVAVNHGNSGGPLLDESGAIIGLTDWGFQPEGDNSHNFFVPVGDALDFLAIKPAREAAPATPPPAVAKPKPKARR